MASSISNNGLQTATCKTSGVRALLPCDVPLRTWPPLLRSCGRSSQAQAPALSRTCSQQGSMPVPADRSTINCCDTLLHADTVGLCQTVIRAQRPEGVQPSTLQNNTHTVTAIAGSVSREASLTKAQARPLSGCTPDRTRSSPSTQQRTACVQWHPSLASPL